MTAPASAPAIHGPDCDCPHCGPLGDTAREREIVRRAEERTARKIVAMLHRFRDSEVWEAREALGMAAQAVEEGNWRGEA